jgi:hypothetical protein
MLIDDSFLSNKEIIDLQNTMYANPSTPFWWSFNPFTTDYSQNHPGILRSDKVKDTMQFTHGALYNGVSISPFADVAKELLYKFCSKNNIDILNIFRIKANLITRDCSAEDYYHVPHIDSPHPHLVFLYYVNDADGDTVFFDKKYTGQNIDNFNIENKVTPKAGRGVVFDGLTYHASASPTNSPFRCIININFNGKIK